LEDKRAANLKWFEASRAAHLQLLRELKQLLDDLNRRSTPDEMQKIPAILLRVARSNADNIITLYRTILTDDDRLNALSAELGCERKDVPNVIDPSVILADLACAKEELQDRLNSYITPFQHEVAALETEIVDLHNVLAARQTLAQGQTTLAGLRDKISRSLRPMQIDSSFPTDHSPLNANCPERLEREL
jgi:vacuolar-type H+-ATPase subunit I/STV1